MQSASAAECSCKCSDRKVQCALSDCTFYSRSACNSMCQTPDIVRCQTAVAAVFFCHDTMQCNCSITIHVQLQLEQALEPISVVVNLGKICS